MLIPDVSKERTITHTHTQTYIRVYYQRPAYRYTQRVVIRQACMSIRDVILKAVNLRNIRRI